MGVLIIDVVAWSKSRGKGLTNVLHHNGWQRRGPQIFVIQYIKDKLNVFSQKDAVWYLPV